MSKNVTRVLTLDEIHELTGLSLATLRRYCASGELTAMKRARQWFVREEDYNAFFTPDNLKTAKEQEESEN